MSGYTSFENLAVLYCVYKVVLTYLMDVSNFSDVENSFRFSPVLALDDTELELRPEIESIDPLQLPAGNLPLDLTMILFNQPTISQPGGSQLPPETDNRRCHDMSSGQPGPSRRPRRARE